MTASADIVSCPACGSKNIRILSEHKGQCIKCRVIINSHVKPTTSMKECPLCGSTNLSALPSGNVLCKGCNNSFVSLALDIE